MTTHVPETTVATVPTQAAPVEPPSAAAVIDHVRAHSVKCYWDFTECKWRCSD